VRRAGPDELAEHSEVRVTTKGRYVDAAGVRRKRIALIPEVCRGVGFGNHAIPVDPVSSRSFQKRNVKRMSIPAEAARGLGQCIPQQPEHSDKENRDTHTNDEDQGLESERERWQLCDELFGVIGRGQTEPLPSL